MPMRVKRNAQDATLINIRALKAQVARLQRLHAVERAALTGRVENLEFLLDIIFPMKGRNERSSARH